LAALGHYKSLKQPLVKILLIATLFTFQILLSVNLEQFSMDGTLRCSIWIMMLPLWLFLSVVLFDLTKRMRSIIKTNVAADE